MMAATACAAAALLPRLAAAAAPAAPKPHLIYFMVDDWGWNDVGYHRAEAGAPAREISTPHIDALVKAGVELDRHYIYRWCSPSRASFLSGRLPVHVFQGAGGSMCNTEFGVPPGMTVIATKLKAAGYSTHQFGKWDAGVATPALTPKGRGFDSSLGYFDHCNDYYTYRGQTVYSGGLDHGGLGGPCPINQSITDLWDTDGPATWAGTGTYEEELWSKRAADILAKHDPSVPLFFYYAFHIVHADPKNQLKVPQEWLDKFSFITDSPLRQTYHAMVAYMDDVVGNVTTLLKSKQMWQDTLVVSSSDNGGPIYAGPLPSPAVNGGGANNYPLRGGKISDWEGGVRVNAWASGGFLPAAARGRRVSQFMHVADWYATFCGLAGVDAADAPAAAAGLPPVDSVDAWPLLVGASAAPLRAGMLLSTNTYVDGSGWKLIMSYREGDVTGMNMWSPPIYPNASQPDGGGYGAPADCSAGCVYNVLSDPGERQEMSQAEPAMKQKLLGELSAAQKTIIQTKIVPDDSRCCTAAAEKYGGYLGPWAL